VVAEGDSVEQLSPIVPHIGPCAMINNWGQLFYSRQSPAIGG
jgi:hypothetical protein